MVGAIADWFAVTALFKHPLGLPIPHTALIPKRKDELGKGLEEFVGENFLQEAIIRDRVAAATISLRLGEWLSQPHNARRVVDEVADVAVDRAGPGQGRAHRRAGRVGAGPAVPGGADRAAARHVRGREVVRDDLHHGVVDLALEELHRWLVDNPEHVHRGAERAGAVVGADRGSTTAVTGRLHTEAVALARGHPQRPAAPRPRGVRLECCAQLGQDLLYRPRDPGARRRRSRRGCSTTRSSRRPASRSGTACAAPCCRRSRDPDGPLRDRLLQRAGHLRRPAHRRRGAARPDGRARRRRRGLRRRPVRRRADRRHHAHHRALGRQGGRPPDRAARRPRPPVHPDQRHHRRRPGRRADPHGRRCCSDDASIERADRRRPIRDESIRLGQFLKLANLVESGAEAKPLVASGAVLVNGEVRPAAAGSSSRATS